MLLCVKVSCRYQDYLCAARFDASGVRNIPPSSKRGSDSRLSDKPGCAPVFRPMGYFLVRLKIIRDLKLLRIDEDKVCSMRDCAAQQMDPGQSWPMRTL